MLAETGGERLIGGPTQVFRRGDMLANGDRRAVGWIDPQSIAGGSLGRVEPVDDHEARVGRGKFGWLAKLRRNARIGFKRWLPRVGRIGIDDHVEAALRGE